MDHRRPLLAVVIAVGAVPPATERSPTTTHVDADRHDTLYRLPAAAGRAVWLQVDGAAGVSGGDEEHPARARNKTAIPNADVRRLEPTFNAG